MQIPQGLGSFGRHAVAGGDPADAADQGRREHPGHGGIDETQADPVAMAHLVGEGRPLQDFRIGLRGRSHALSRSSPASTTHPLPAASHPG